MSEGEICFLRHHEECRPFFVPPVEATPCVHRNSKRSAFHRLDRDWVFHIGACLDSISVRLVVGMQNVRITSALPSRNEGDNFFIILAISLEETQHLAKSAVEVSVQCSAETASRKGGLSGWTTGLEGNQATKTDAWQICLRPRGRRSPNPLQS